MTSNLEKDFLNVCICCLDKTETKYLTNMMSLCQIDCMDSSLIYTDLIEYCVGVQFPKIYITPEIITGPFMCELCVIKLRDMCIFKNQMEESYTRLGQISKSTSGVKVEMDVLEDFISDIDIFPELKDDISEDYIPYEKKSKKNKKKRRKKHELITNPPNSIPVETIVLKENFDKRKFSYPAICQHCGKILHNKSQFQSHNMTHDGVVQCEVCKRYVKKISIRHHLRTVHYGDLIYTCNQCPMRFKYYHVRQKHLFDVHNITLKVFECKMCPLTFSSSSSRAVHIRKFHLKHRPYKCTECNRAFFEKKDLASHMLCHTGEKNFECTVCEKKFSRKKSLAEHMKIHLNIKKFKCDICQKAFTQKCTLVGHMKTHDRD